MRVVMVAEYDVPEEDEDEIRAAMRSFADQVRDGGPVRPVMMYVAIREIADAIVGTLSAPVDTQP